jgi:hypothetical protein
MLSIHDAGGCPHYLTHSTPICLRTLLSCPSNLKQTLLHLHLYLGDFVNAFIQSDLELFIQTFTHRRRSQPREGTASWSGAVRGRRLAQGHLSKHSHPRHTLEGAWDRASNPPVTRQPPPSLLSYCRPRVSRTHSFWQGSHPWPPGSRPQLPFSEPSTLNFS